MTDLFDLVWLCHPSFRLKIENFGNPIFRKDVMISIYAPIKA